MIQARRIGHATFETPDLDGAIDYYTQVNGLVLAEREPGRAFLASKIGMLYAPPFTFLTVRFLFGIACMVPIVLIMRPAWPAMG